MTKDNIRQAFNDVYDWWKKYRDVVADDKILDQMAQEGYEIIRKFQAEELVVHMVNDLVREMEYREEKTT